MKRNCKFCNSKLPAEYLLLENPYIGDLRKFTLKRCPDALLVGKAGTIFQGGCANFMPLYVQNMLWTLCWYVEHMHWSRILLFYSTAHDEYRIVLFGVRTLHTVKTTRHPVLRSFTLCDSDCKFCFFYLHYFFLFSQPWIFYCPVADIAE